MPQEGKVWFTVTHFLLTTMECLRFDCSFSMVVEVKTMSQVKIFDLDLRRSSVSDIDVVLYSEDQTESLAEEEGDGAMSRTAKK